MGLGVVGPHAQVHALLLSWHCGCMLSFQTNPMGYYLCHEFRELPVVSNMHKHCSLSPSQTLNHIC